VFGVKLVTAKNPNAANNAADRRIANPPDEHRDRSKALYRAIGILVFWLAGRAAL
jgi:hypothetical protein